MTATGLGPIVTGWQVEVGALQTIETWLATYLSALDRAVFNSTTAVIPRPPAPGLQLPDDTGKDSGLSSSIHGGIDFLTTSSGLMPEVIIEVQPDEEPVYFGNGDYTVSYELSVAAQVYGQDETLARMYASLYGSALTTLIMQNGDLGGFATRTRLTGAPVTSFVDTDDSDDALLVQSLTTFLVYVDGSYNDQAGIAAPVAGDTLTAPDPALLPPEWPTADVVSIAFAYVQASADAADANFSPVIDPLYPSDSLYPSDTLYPEG